MTPEELDFFRDVHGKNGHRVGYDPDRYATIAEAIAEAERQATLTERARCVRIARGLINARNEPTLNDYQQGFMHGMEIIAAAIEKDTSFPIEAGEEDK